MWKFASFGAIAAVTAALAHAPGAGQGTKRGAGGDPNAVVCIKERELGSRLAVRRVCRTRAEWDEYNRQLRMVVEKVQSEKNVGNN